MGSDATAERIDALLREGAAERDGELMTIRLQGQRELRGEGCAGVAQYISSHCGEGSGVKRLDLQLPSCGVFTEGLEALEVAVAALPPLESLRISLDGSGIFEGALQTLGRLLARHKSAVELEVGLGGNNLREIEPFARA